MKFTKQDKLLEWTKWKGVFSSQDASNWGGNNFYLRACRTIRQFAEDGMIRRLTKQEILDRGLNRNKNSRIGWFSYDGDF